MPRYAPLVLESLAYRQLSFPCSLIIVLVAFFVTSSVKSSCFRQAAAVVPVVYFVYWMSRYHVTQMVFLV